MKNTADSLETKRERLKQLVIEKSFIKDGDFKLASGASSNFFFDMKVTMLDPEGASLIADVILDKIKDDKVDAVGGLVVGACPIVSSVCTKSFDIGSPVQGFYVRKEPKQRGTQKMIEGQSLKSGDRVVMLEDVTTSGGSVLKAIDEVKALGCVVVKVVTIVDREQGASDNLAKAGLVLDPVFCRADFE